MRYLISVVAVIWVLLVCHEPALACTTQTIMTPDGRTLFCMTCCTGGHCTTTCN